MGGIHIHLKKGVIPVERYAVIHSAFDVARYLFHCIHVSFVGNGLASLDSAQSENVVRSGLDSHPVGSAGQVQDVMAFRFLKGLAVLIQFPAWWHRDRV